MSSADPIASTPPQPAPKGKEGSGCLKSCLITSIILILIAAGGVYLAVRYAGGFLRSQAASAISQFTAEFLRDSNLPAEEKRRLEAVMSNFARRIESGEIGAVEAADIMKRLSDGPIVPALSAAAFRAAAIEPSALPPAEKEAARLVTNRFIAGLATGSIPKADADTVLQVWTNFNRTSAEIDMETTRRIIASMQRLADRAGVPSQPPRPDLAAHLERLLEGDRR